ncbi:WYL domain-containing protein [Streptomyces sp. TX20-6-3]|uniref:WYL domain-containing protein n=1 Tax=Streptomyces sp. TX20-6-3 TaxID=3028705 RepID=UPI0029B7293E|nr:WYL domain-containing protein [Streptomyces sp. TX20-6-3]MDX2565156.1 WYL domain-containing protein [Streptomyces sp. TX20-6-3]
MPRFSLARRRALLERASVTFRVVEIDYTDVDSQTTTRRIAIDEILTSKNGDTYAKVFCSMRRELRSIRLDRITRHRSLCKTYSVEDLELAA